MEPELLLMIVSGALIIVGIIGAVLPVLPGLPLSFLGILLFKFSDRCEYGWTTVLVLGLITGVTLLLDYIIPVIGNKKFGGSRYGTVGCLIGMVIGLLFFPPLGMIIGTFAGAVIFEMLFNAKELKPSLKAGLGVFIGFISSTFINFLTSLLLAYIFFTSIR